MTVDTQTRQALTFEFPQSRIHAGADMLDALGDVVRDVGGRRALVVAGSNVSNNEPIRRRVTDSLGSSMVGWFAEAQPYVPHAVVAAAVALARDTGADSIVGVGGGSAIDTAKSVSAVLGTSLDVAEYVDRFCLREQAGVVVVPDLPSQMPPVVVVPTTLSGAELNGATSVLIEGRGRLRLRSLQLTPRAVVYDARAAASTPRHILRATGINALDHGVEIYYARGNNTLIKGLALASVRVLASNLAVLGNDDQLDLDAVSALQVGSGLAATWMNSILILERRGHGLTHAISHALGSRGGMQQGDAHAVMMPHCMRFVAAHVGPGMRELASALGVTAVAADPVAAAGSAADRVVQIRDSLGLPSRLRDYLPRTGLAEIAEHAMRDFSIRSTPRSVQIEDVLKLLQDAW